MNDYEYPLFDDNGKVICQMCGKSFLVISPKHLVNHKVTYSEYKLRFSNAPLSSAEFDSRSKYGKEKGIFQEEESPVENFIGDETFVDEEPEVEEEIDLQRVIDSEKRDPIQDAKYKIFDHLRMYLSNVKMDYSIRENWPDGRTIFEFITDFADPILKIDIECMKVFWHNRDQFVDLNRNQKLKERGWKVIEINSKSPTFDEIDKALKNI
jgi:very-short-patch-repair endonuclease